LAELEWQGRPERASLRRALRHGLRSHAPTLRVIAEDYLAESTSIDLLAVGVEGDLVSIRIGPQTDEASLFTRALSDLAWLRPRLPDLLKLAPGLGLEASADPRAMVFCPHFASETRLAAQSLPTRSIELLEYRCLRQQGQLVLLLEPSQSSRDSDRARADLDPAEPPISGSPRLGTHGAPGAVNPRKPADFGAESRTDRLTDPPSPSTFRTGLTDADLRIEPLAAHARR